MPRYYDRIHHPEFSDMAVVLGTNVRWVEDDYRDLQEHAPEVLLGYRVRLFSVDSVLRGMSRGLRIEKLVVLDGPDMYGRRAEEAVMDLYYGQIGAHFPKVERYRVHRGYTPVVLKL